MNPQIETACQDAAHAGLLHGVVLAAGTGGSLTVLEAWGLATVTPEPVPMRTDAIFDLASVTKAVATASACAVCIDEGLLDPEAPVAEYLPGIGRFASTAVCVKDLATHTSGFDNRKFDALDPAAMLQAMVETPAQWAPGERFEYSCRNFVILGRIVETLTGQGLAAFCQQRLFGPLGMADTAFGPLATNLDRVVPSSVAAGIISDEQARRATCAIGNAGLFATATDLATFCRMILRGGKGVLGPQSLNWLLKPCTPAGLPRRSFGWDLRPVAESPCRPTRMSARAIGHSGWTGQSIWIDPEQDIFTIVLTNRTHQPGRQDNYVASKQFRSQVADLLIGQVLDPF